MRYNASKSRSRELSDQYRLGDKLFRERKSFCDSQGAARLNPAKHRLFCKADKAESVQRLAVSTLLCKLMAGRAAGCVVPMAYGSGAVAMELLTLDVGKNSTVVVVLRLNKFIIVYFCASLTHQPHVTGRHLPEMAHLLARH